MSTDKTIVGTEFLFAKDIKNESFRIIINLYKVKVKINDDIFDYLIAKYKIIIVGGETYLNTAIMNVLPNDAKITYTGMYNKVFDLGGYACKFIEYSDQAGDFEKISLDSNYVFIGNDSYFSKVFPINELILPELIIPDVKTNTTNAYIDDVIVPTLVPNIFNTNLICPKLTKNENDTIILNTLSCIRNLLFHYDGTRESLKDDNLCQQLTFFTEKFDVNLFDENNKDLTKFDIALGKFSQ